jgi:hypothetical protein
MAVVPHPPPATAAFIERWKNRLSEAGDRGGLAAMIQAVTTWIDEIDYAAYVARDLCQWGKLGRLDNERRALHHTLDELREHDRSRKILADGTVVTSRSSVHVDEEGMEEERLAREEAMIRRHGSLEAAEQHGLAEVRRLRAARAAAVWRMRFDARSRLAARLSTPRIIRPLARTRGAGRPRVRRTSSSSRTSSADPGDGEPAAGPPRSLGRYLAASGLRASAVRWCRRCGVVAPCVDAYQRDALGADGFTERACPDCNGVAP